MVGEGVDIDEYGVAAATLGESGARVVDGDLAHRAGHGCVEVGAIGVVEAGAFKLQIRLVDQGPGIERVSALVARELGPGDADHVLIDQGEQALAPCRFGGIGKRGGDLG